VDLHALCEKPVRYAVGLMSGSSCDGVDAALVRLKGTGPDLRVKLIAFQTRPYSDTFRRKLQDDRLGIRDIVTLDTDLGRLMAEAAQDMLTIAEEHDCTIDFVASHGHTLAHVPPRPNSRGVGTLQIGEPAIIAQRTQLPVVSDFRPADLALGGQGAPLTPYADWALFRKDDRTDACLNIGGIANITVITPDIKQVLAFDTGPGNMPIDYAVSTLVSGHTYDKNGKLAASGRVIEPMLQALLDHAFLHEAPPKSTGREEFGGDVYLKDLLGEYNDHSPEDIICTVTRAVASGIVDAYDRFVAPHHTLSRIIVSGGGAYNKTLMRFLKEDFEEVQVFSSDRLGLRADAREAIAFAILGNETICQTPANVPSATGASAATVLGKITPP
jgi:anhydro-N-acetylmuramic acid kinase